jgi:hypothetical protein
MPVYGFAVAIHDDNQESVASAVVDQHVVEALIRIQENVLDFQLFPRYGWLELLDANREHKAPNSTSPNALARQVGSLPGVSGLELAIAGAADNGPVVDFAERIPSARNISMHLSHHA